MFAISTKLWRTGLSKSGLEPLWVRFTSFSITHSIVTWSKARSALPALLLCTLVVISCADESAQRCATELCPEGTSCDQSTGKCVDIGPVSPGDSQYGVWSSAALTPDNELMVASYDRMHGSLALIRVDDVGVLQTQLVDGGLLQPGNYDVGQYPSLALGPNGQPRIAYYDKTHGDLKVARVTNGAWQIFTADSGGDDGLLDVGKWASLAVDGADGLHMAYRDATQSRMRILSLGQAGCKPVDEEGRVLENVPVELAPPEGRAVGSEDYGQWASLGITGNGLIVVSYYDAARGNLVLVTCGGNGVTQQVLDGEDLVTGHDTGDVGLWSSLAIDTNGNAGVGYYDRTRRVLKFARSYQGDVEIVIVDDGIQLDSESSTSHVVGQHAALAFDTDGNPRIVYGDATSRSIKIAWGTTYGFWGLEVVSDFPLASAVSGLGLGLDLVVDPLGRAHIVYASWIAQGDTVTVDLNTKVIEPPVVN